MASNPFEFGRYDRIHLDEVEITLEIDGKDKKAFVRKEGDRSPFIMDNDEIKSALDGDELVVERNYYDPRRKDLFDLIARYARDLPMRQQQKIGRKLFWIMLLRQKREAIGGIPHDRRAFIMAEIRADFMRDYKDMTKLAALGVDVRIHYNKLPSIGEPPPYDTVAKWSSKLEKAGGDARALIDGRGLEEKVSKFSTEERELQGRFVWRVCSSTEPNVDYLFRLMKAVERRLNKHRPPGMQLDLGSRSTFYNRVAAIPDFAIYLGRYGEAKAKAKYNIVIGKDRGLPMDLVEADECRLDIVALLEILGVMKDLSEDEQEAFRRARLWCSAVVDHATGYFLSFKLHTRHPSVDTARAVFELVTINKTQIAQNAGCKSDWSQTVGLRKVRLDCASWYASDAVITTITDASASKLHPPVKKPWLRGTMERVFGILSALTLQSFSGQTFSNVVKRGDRDPTKGASVDPAMLEAVFLRAIVDIYHNIKSTGKLGGMSRRQAWDEGCAIKPPPPPPTSFHRRHIYGLNLERVITTEGIEVMGFFYQSLEIQRMRRNRTAVKVNIRIDIWDLGEITAFDETGLSYRVPARLERMKGMSYWKATTLLHELQLIDVAYTDRTLEHVDDAILAIDNYAEVARMTHSIASPIITQEHVDRVEKHIQRPMRAVEVSTYTRQLSTQDFSMVPFLAEAWGLADEPDADDLEVAASQSEAAVAAKYGEPVKSKRKGSKKGAEAHVTKDETAQQYPTRFSARYTEEH